MATVRKDIITKASPEQVWDAIADLENLHTRLVPGYVIETKMEPDNVRVVTIAGGMTVREPVVSIEPDIMRLVWTAETEFMSHYNASFQVYPESDNQSRVLWTVDVLPNDVVGQIEELMVQALGIMKSTLDQAAEG